MYTKNKKIYLKDKKIIRCTVFAVMKVRKTLKSRWKQKLNLKK